MSMRPENCPPDLGESKRCPNCGQRHLRPGYCQALDPINADKYPQQARAPSLKIVETDNTAETDNCETDSELETDNGGQSCAECGKPFQPARTDARYCSAACRVKAHRRSPKGAQP